VSINQGMLGDCTSTILETEFNTPSMVLPVQGSEPCSKDISITWLTVFTVSGENNIFSLRGDGGGERPVRQTDKRRVGVWVIWSTE
jgi:hypothetical protein